MLYLRAKYDWFFRGLWYNVYVTLLYAERIKFVKINKTTDKIRLSLFYKSTSENRKRKGDTNGKQKIYRVCRYGR